jgi:heme exporter protein A
MLTVHELSCERGTRLLFEDLAFAVEPGMLLHVQGSNGSGKTSLLRLLCGLSTPAAGRVCWDSEDIRELDEEYASQLTYIGHQPALKDNLSALENLRFAQALAGQPVTPDQVQDALRAIGLLHGVNLPLRVLSQGQRRRVALARLWLCNRPLWILDEPFAALDASAIRLVEKHLEAHLTQGGMIVLTTHQEPAIAPENTQVLRLLT